jgi:drug/metabolite transporter (DMT)-like permease
MGCKTASVTTARDPLTASRPRLHSIPPPVVNPLLVMGFVVVVWGLGPPITKLVTAPPLVGASIRFGISFPVLFAVVVARGGRIDRELLRTTALPGIAFGLNLVFVFAALQEATVAVLSTTVAIQPAILLFVAGPIFGERPSMRHVIWSLVGVLGAAIVIMGAGSDVRASPLGIGLALVALATFSVYFVLTRIARSTTSVDPIRWMAGVNFWAFVATLPPAAIWVRGSDLAQFGGMDWVWIAIVAYITGATGHVAMGWVHAYIEAARSSLYLLAMHLVAVGLAWPIHNEPVTLVQVLGGVVLLGSVAAVTRIPVRTDPVLSEPIEVATP